MKRRALFAYVIPGIKYPVNETFLANLFDRFHRVPTKAGAARTPNVRERQKRLINLQQTQNDRPISY